MFNPIWTKRSCRHVYCEPGRGRHPRAAQGPPRNHRPADRRTSRPDLQRRPGDAPPQSQVRTRLSAGGRWIRTSGSARDCTTVEVGSRASPVPSSSLRRRGPDWSGRPTAEAWVPHREEIPRPHPSALTASPAAMFSDPVRLCRLVARHTRGKTRALPPCFYRRHRAHSPASLAGRFRPPGRHGACPGPPTAAIPDRLSVRQSCCRVSRLGPGLSDNMEVTADR